MLHLLLKAGKLEDSLQSFKCKQVKKKYKSGGVATAPPPPPLEGEGYLQLLLSITFILTDAIYAGVIDIKLHYSTLNTTRCVGKYFFFILQIVHSKNEIEIRKTKLISFSLVCQYTQPLVYRCHRLH